VNSNFSIADQLSTDEAIPGLWVLWRIYRQPSVKTVNAEPLARAGLWISSKEDAE